MYSTGQKNNKITYKSFLFLLKPISKNKKRFNARTDLDILIGWLSHLYEYIDRVAKLSL